VAGDQPERWNQQGRSCQHHGSSRQSRAIVIELQQYVVRFYSSRKISVFILFYNFFSRELDADTFNVHTVLKSISLHNNNFLCLNGALDTLIDMNILQRLRLTGNSEIIDNQGGEIRYRGHSELMQFKDISDELVCV